MRHRDPPQFGRMLELQMTTNLRHLVPSIHYKLTDRFTAVASGSRALLYTLSTHHICHTPVQGIHSS